MTWLETSTENCSVQRALDILGSKWTLLILRDAMNGVRRFDDFHRHVGVPEPVLADRLRALVSAGILTTRDYQVPGQRARREYLLTDRGWDLQPSLVALMQWGDRHLADPSGPAMSLRHRDCDSPVEAVVQCVAEGHAVHYTEVIASAGPSARPLARLEVDQR